MLRPQITVAPGPSVPRVERLVHLAHGECYVANSLATPVAVEPAITFSSAICYGDRLSSSASRAR